MECYKYCIFSFIKDGTLYILYIPIYQGWNAINIVYSHLSRMEPYKYCTFSFIKDGMP